MYVSKHSIQFKCVQSIASLRSLVYRTQTLLRLLLILIGIFRYKDDFTVDSVVGLFKAQRVHGRLKAPEIFRMEYSGFSVSNRKR